MEEKQRASKVKVEPAKRTPGDTKGKRKCVPTSESVEKSPQTMLISLHPDAGEAICTEVTTHSPLSDVAETMASLCDAPLKNVMLFINESDERASARLVLKPDEYLICQPIHIFVRLRQGFASDRRDQNVPVSPTTKDPEPSEPKPTQAPNKPVLNKPACGNCSLAQTADKCYGRPGEACFPCRIPKPNLTCAFPGGSSASSPAKEGTSPSTDVASKPKVSTETFADGESVLGCWRGRWLACTIESSHQTKAQTSYLVLWEQDKTRSTLTTRDVKANE